MGQALDKGIKAQDAEDRHAAKPLDWRKKMSDHVAFALLVYTALQIFATATVLKGQPGSIMPYFGLIFLVAAIIPACRIAENRWDSIGDEAAQNPELAGAFRRDAILLWICAIGMPLLMAGIFSAIGKIL